MTEKTPILKGRKIKTRILRPDEYMQLRKYAKSGQRALLDSCLCLGARFEECRAIQKNPLLFDGNFIALPWEEQRKVKQIQSQRFIRLSHKGKTLMPFFFEAPKLPTSQAWNRTLKKLAERAGLDPVGITTRTLRKTYESWLIFYFPGHTHDVYLSQGHSNITSLTHYTNMPFLDADRADMKEWCEGWI